MIHHSPSNPPAEFDDDVLFVWYDEPFSATLRRSLVVWTILHALAWLDRACPVFPGRPA